jgi:UDP-glucose 4-epimerase
VKREQWIFTRWIGNVAEMQRVLITGGAGFIGSHLAEALVAAGAEVSVLDDLSTGTKGNLSALEGHSRFRFVEGSVLEPATVERLVAGVDFVYHLAATVGVELVMHRPMHTLEANVVGTENVLAAAARCGAGMLLSSTSEVYGKSVRERFSEEDDLLIGPPAFSRWGYACSKLLDEFLALAYWRERNLPVFIVRLFNTVGPRQTGRYGMVLPRFVEQAVRGEPITIYGDGRQTRCFCHVSDVVRALVELPCRKEASGEVFNVGSTEEVAIAELARQVNTAAGGRSELKFVSYEAAYAKGFEDMRRRVPDVGRIQRLIGWKPTLSLAEIVRRMVSDKTIAFSGRLG